MTAALRSPKPSVNVRRDRQQMRVSSILSFLKPKANQREEQKAKLLETVTPLSRGLTATEADKEAVEAIVRSLEKSNPTKAPLKSPLLNGKWKLLYTTSSSILGVSKPAIFRPSGPIYQYLDNRSLTARNQESAPLYNSVTADLTPVSEDEVAVRFREFKIFGLITVKAPESAVGSLRVTYLDEGLRISRGDKGNLFVLSMDEPDALP